MNDTTIPNEVNTPEVQKITNSALAVVESVSHYVVTTDEEFQNGASTLAQIKSAQKEVDAQRMAITRPMDEAKKRVMSFFGQFSDRLNNAEASVKKALGKYQDEQERIAAEAARIERERIEKEERRLRELAAEADRKAAEKERKRLAEQQRIAEERAQVERARIAEERRIAQEAADADAMRRAEEQAAAQAKREAEEQERLHRERLAAEEAQRERSARALVLEERADALIAAPPAPATPKVSGLSSSMVWDFEITDRAQIPDQYKTIDEKKIRGVVKALKADANIPGVRVFQKRQMASRAG